jgi:hypothetical protein
MLAAAGITARENELQNSGIATFLDALTQRGRLMQ